MMNKLPDIDFTPKERNVIDYLHGYSQFGLKNIEKMDNFQIKENYYLLLKEIQRIHGDLRKKIE